MILLWLLLLFPGPAKAQEPLEGAITFSTTTQLVIVNVAVRDKSGKPLEGLEAADFTLLEDGKPQKLVVFEYQKLDEAPLPRLPLGPRPDPAAIPQLNPSGAPAEVRYKDRRLLVMFFDQSSMPPAEFWRAQDAALKFLREQMTSADVVAVMSYNRQFELLQDFTDDRDQLLTVIGSMVAGNDEEQDGLEDGDEDAEFSIFNTDRKLAALEDAVRMLGRLAERKALIYFGNGAGGTGSENQSQLRATVNAAQRGNVVFYPVDARGLVAQAPMGNASVASPGGAGMYSGEAMRASAIRIGGEDETMYRLAKETGGKSLVDTNDLAIGLQQAQRDLSSYYILGYSSTNPEPDGKYRRIKVQFTRKMAASLDYRTGYFAAKEFKNFNTADRERQLEEALQLGDPITDLPMAIEVDYFRVDRARYYVPVAVKIPGAEIPLPEQGSGARLDFIGQMRNAAGALAATVRDDIEVQLQGDAAAQLASRTLQYDTAFLLSPGSYTLKFLARENQSGKMGTFETTFVVPDLTTEYDYLPISSVVLSNYRQNVSAAPAANAKRDRGAPARNPLVQDGEKLVPSVTRVFRKDQQMYVYLEAYQPLSATGELPVTVRVGFYRGGVKAFESEPLLVMDGMDPAWNGLPVKLSVPLTALHPGRYTCQISVLAPTAGKFAFWRAPVVVLP